MEEACSSAGLTGLTEVIIGEGGSGGTGERAAALMVRDRDVRGWGGRDVGQSGRVRGAGDTSTEKSSKFHRNHLQPPDL